MYRYFAVLLLWLAFVFPAQAQVCNSDSGFVKLLGEILPGNALTLADDCESLVDTGLPISGVVQGTYYATSFGIVCDNFTDNTAAFAAMSAAIPVGQSAKIIFPRGVCRTTFWNFSSRSNFIIEGQGGQDITEIVAGTMIACTRSDANICFNFGDTKGYVFQNLTLGYTSTTYSGTLLFLAQTASTWVGGAFYNVQFKQIGATTRTGLAAVYLRNAVQINFFNTKFSQFQVGVIGGFDGETIINTTLIKFIGCTFIALEQAGVSNPGTEWSFTDSWFFPSFAGAPNGIRQTDATYAIENLDIKGTAFTDATIAGIWIDIKQAIALKISGGVIAGNANFPGQIGLRLCNIVGASIDSVYFGFLDIGIQLTTSAGCVVTSANGVTIGGGNALATNTTGISGFVPGTILNYLAIGNNCASCNSLNIFVGKSVTFNNTQTYAGSDGKTITHNASTTFGGVDGKTVTFNNTQTFAGTDGKIITHNATTTFGGVDGKTLTINNSGTLGGGDGFTLAIAANKTFTLSNSMTFNGTDGNTYTFPNVSGDTVALLAASQAFTNKTYNGNTWTAGTGTLTIAAGKTLTTNNSIQLSGTDGTTMTFPNVSATIPGLAVANTFTANQTLTLSQAAATQISINNTNTSTSATATLNLTSNSGTFTASAANNPNTTGSAAFTWNGSGAMFFAATNAAGVLVFDTGGFNERMRIQASGAAVIGNSGVDLAAAGRIYIDDYIVTAPKTVGTLSTCNATSKGARSFVTDANATFTAGIGAVVAAGGANNVPVTCDGTSWRIGANDNRRLANVG